MPLIQVWFLLIDHDHKPSFGDPISELAYDEETIHKLKLRLKEGNNKIDFCGGPANRIEIWKCTTLKLSHKDTLNRLKQLLSNITFSDGEDSDIQLLAAGQSVTEVGLKHGELLLAVVPKISMPLCFLCSRFFY
jgi:hypothetical protein